MIHFDGIQKQTQTQRNRYEDNGSNNINEWMISVIIYSNC
jgi:hypothetical protein